MVGIKFIEFTLNKKYILIIIHQKKKNFIYQIICPNLNLKIYVFY